MAGINKAIIVGNLGSDPEIRSMPNGDLVATLSIATSETWTDKNSGEKRENVQWHRVVFYRKPAEICQQYLKKGHKIYIEGRFQTRSWKDPKTQETKYAMEILGSVLQMLGSKPLEGENNAIVNEELDF